MWGNAPRRTEQHLFLARHRMKYITVKLTEDQARTVLESLEMNKNFGMFGNDPVVGERKAFIQRIVDKLAKAKSS